jgi:hypothetical protein
MNRLSFCNGSRKGKHRIIKVVVANASQVTGQVFKPIHTDRSTVANAGALALPVFR